MLESFIIYFEKSFVKIISWNLKVWFSTNQKIDKLKKNVKKPLEKYGIFKFCNHIVNQNTFLETKLHKNIWSKL